ncbi:Uu.00g129370.m01.CDS01 [Anthostomella pinea]|uniref:Uu.00g129370.m01.CDS01 n=1 Tax=Anthostomella pinea TaxID=933095 RepID=A0AAI8VIE9_9PEZI|nr:Uu.00g129370.m01.CDS01 [Anthostomella pinea]
MAQNTSANQRDKDGGIVRLDRVQNCVARNVKLVRKFCQPASQQRVVRETLNQHLLIDYDDRGVRRCCRWNGLIAAKTYLDFEQNANLVLLDDQSSIGGVWCAEKIYPSLFAQIKYRLFEYSFYPMRNEGVSADGYISGETINTYLNDFARDYGLVRRTRLRTKVVKVDRLAGKGWRLDLAGKPPIECAKLIYASGATSHPVIPSWPQTEFHSPIIHSSELGAHLEALDKIRTAMVVGAAKSAYDVVFHLLKAGKQVNWIIREDGSGPLAIMPPTILGLVNTMDAVATKVVAALGASIMQTDGPTSYVLQRTRVGRTLTRAFWSALTAIADRHAGYAKSPNAEKLRPLPYGNGYVDLVLLVVVDPKATPPPTKDGNTDHGPRIFWANAGLGAASVPHFWKVFHAGDCTVHRSEIASMTDGATMTLRNGARFQTDYVILCTGFDKSYQPFDAALQAELALKPNAAEETKWSLLEARAEQRVDELLPVLKDSSLTPPKQHSASAGATATLAHGPSRHYRRLVVPSLVAQGDRSVYFPGFIHSIYTPLVSEVQALWGVTFLLGLHDPPPLAAMEREVAEWNVWSRKRYPTQGRKHAYAIYDFISYIDLLLGDLGINTRRRSNPLAEMFLPAYPYNYKGLIDEFRSARGKGSAEGMQSGGRARGSLVALCAVVFFLFLICWRFGTTTGVGDFA